MLDFFRAPAVDEDGERDERRFIERWVDQHSNGEDANMLWGSKYAPPKAYFEVGTYTDWSRFGFGLEVQRQFLTRSWPNRIDSHIAFGPWSLYANVEWGAVR